jgi:hypothetical protein
VEFLAQTEVPLGSLQELNRGKGIPIDTLKSWRKKLPRDPQILTYFQPANVRWPRNKKTGLCNEFSPSLLTKRNFAHRK